MPKSKNIFKNVIFINTNCCDLITVILHYMFTPVFNHILSWMVTWTILML